MADSQAGFIGVLLLHLPAGAELHPVIGFDNRLHGFLGEVGVYALADSGLVAISDAGYALAIPQLSLLTETTVIRYRLAGSFNVGACSAVHPFRLRLW